MKKKSNVPQMKVDSLTDAMLKLAVKHSLACDTHEMTNPFPGLTQKYNFVSQIIGPGGQILCGFLHVGLNDPVTVQQAQVLARLDAYITRHPPPEETS